MIYINILLPCITLLIVVHMLLNNKLKEEKRKREESKHLKYNVQQDTTDIPDNDNMPLDGEFLVSKYIVYRGCHVKLLNNGNTYITFPAELHKLMYDKGEQYRTKYPVRLCRQPDITIAKCWYFNSDKYTMSEIIKHSKYIIDDIYMAKNDLDKIVNRVVQELLGD